jgi:sulfoxide reductase heme-binding subunit YedZ
MALWHDKRGRFSPLRAVTLAALMMPVLALLYFTATHDLGPRPRTEAIHEVGLWAIRFLVLDLFITPMRRIGRYAALVDVRRMIGVAVFCYMVLHFALYIADQMFDMAKVVSEIVLRYYLTIGFVTWLGLAALAITSNDTMVRKLGGLRWRKLHQLVYPIVILGTIHFFMQAKLEVFEPTVIGGLFAWLLIYRLMHWRFPRGGEFPLWIIAASWFGVGAAVFFLEALAFHIAFGVPILRILAVDFDFQAGIRPGWYIWGVGALVTLIGVWRMRPEGRPAQFAASSAGRTPN